MTKPSPLHFSPDQSAFMRNTALTAGYMISGMELRLLANLSEGGKEIEDSHVKLAEALVDHAVCSETLLRAEFAGMDHPGVYDYEVSEEFGTWFAQYLIDRGQLPPNDEAREVLLKMAKDYFGQGSSPAPIPKAPEPNALPGLNAHTLLYCYTGVREASAFCLGDLAKATGRSLGDFLSACEDRNETIDDATKLADPILRSSIEGYGSDHLALHNLKLSVPGGITVDELLTQLDEANGSKRSFHMRVR